MTKIEITEIEEHDDGSATLQVDCDAETFGAIFSLGFVTAVKAGLDKEREMIRPMTDDERKRSIERNDPREARRQALLRNIAAAKVEWQKLSNEHMGVRPSWISGDLSSLETRILFMRRELEAMDDE